MNRFYLAVAERAGHRCEYCQAPERLSNVAFEVEHITPIASGGMSVVVNLALSCRSCNQFKSDLTEAVDPETNGVTRLFHPRQDNWDDHFEVELDRAEIVGRTPLGRATVACLHMNRAIAVSARRLWIEFNVFP